MAYFQGSLTSQKSQNSMRTVTVAPPDTASVYAPSIDRLCLPDPAADSRMALVEGMSTRRPSPHHRAVSATVPALGLSNTDDTRHMQTSGLVPNITSYPTRLSEEQTRQIVEDEAHLRQIGWKALRDASPRPCCRHCLRAGQSAAPGTIPRAGKPRAHDATSGGLLPLHPHDARKRAVHARMRPPAPALPRVRGGGACRMGEGEPVIQLVRNKLRMAAVLVRGAQGARAGAHGWCTDVPLRIDSFQHSEHADTWFFQLQRR
ncbi:hypothetical protein JB92DRAFT_2834142 [Gautieria morchelliformis]|nr:hypothetical protein JB92DRAFT_2834142 [Gautieria morchelliformis]